MVRQVADTFSINSIIPQTVLDDGVDYVKIAEAMGAAARRVTTQEEFNAAFQEALESKTPFVIDAIVDSDDKVWPMVAPGAPINECSMEKISRARINKQQHSKI